VPYQFEWDADKAAGNLRKHGVPFDEAVTAFNDPLSVLLSLTLITRPAKSVIL